MSEEDELYRVLVCAKLKRMKQNDAAREKAFKEKLSKALLLAAIVLPVLNTSFHVTGSNIYTPSINTVSSTITPNYDYVEPITAKPVKAAKTPKKAINQSKPKADIFKVRKSPYSGFELKLPGRKVNAFDEAFAFTLKHEGGLCIDSNGAWANRGVNQAYYHPLPGMPRSVKNLSLAQTKKYYKVKYWAPLHLERGNYSRRYQMFLFDTAVNKGVGRAGKLHAKAKGDLDKAIALRKAHVHDWVKLSKQNRIYKAGLLRRAESFRTV